MNKLEYQIKADEELSSSYSESKSLHLFSKYSFVKSFKTAKNKEQQAVLIADAIRNSHQILFQHLATKEDLNSLKKQIGSLREEFEGLEGKFEGLRGEFKDFKKEIKQEITDFRKEVKQDMKLIGSQMVNKLGAITVSALGIFFTALVALLKVFPG